MIRASIISNAANQETRNKRDSKIWEISHRQLNSEPGSDACRFHRSLVTGSRSLIGGCWRTGITIPPVAQEGREPGILGERD